MVTSGVRVRAPPPLLVCIPLTGCAHKVSDTFLQFRITCRVRFGGYFSASVLFSLASFHVAPFAELAWKGWLFCSSQSCVCQTMTIYVVCLSAGPCHRWPIIHQDTELSAHARAGLLGGYCHSTVLQNSVRGSTHPWPHFGESAHQHEV